ncbi:MAG: HD-GYP domain-containing protein [Thermoleophilaceae bacterium]
MRARGDDLPAARRTSLLSGREREVLEQVALGKSTDAIALDLVLSPHTVRAHLKNIHRKLDTASRAHAVALLMEERGDTEAAGAPTELDPRKPVVEALTRALDARDPYTSSHCQDVTALARFVAQELGLSRAEMRDVEDVAALHDIGKLGVPESILWKPGPLDPVEQTVMRRHAEIGAGIVAHVEPIAHLATAVRAEHERWDGAGYPDGLTGDEIPVASRIVLACDSYDAMVTDRAYRRAMNPLRARDELRRNSGTQFDPQVVDALLRVLQRRA